MEASLRWQNQGVVEDFHNSFLLWQKEPALSAFVTNVMISIRFVKTVFNTVLPARSAGHFMIVWEAGTYETMEQDNPDPGRAAEPGAEQRIGRSGAGGHQREYDCLSAGRYTGNTYICNP